MTDRTAFIRAIVEHPDSDAPRLVYADYLDERGDERGEFIRLQVEWQSRMLFTADAANDSGWVSGKRHGQPLYSRREIELWCDHARDWIGPGAQQRWRMPVLDRPTNWVNHANGRDTVPYPTCRTIDIPPIHPADVYWHRGFVDAVRCPLGWWYAHGAELVQREPTIRLVVITDRTPEQRTNRFNTEWRLWTDQYHDRNWLDDATVVPAAMTRLHVHSLVDRSRQACLELFGVEALLWAQRKSGVVGWLPQPEPEPHYAGQSFAPLFSGIP